MIRVPKEIRDIAQWTHSFSPAELKRPKHTTYKPNGALTYADVLRRVGSNLLKGFYVTKEDPYVLVDIDHVDNPDDPFGELPLGLSHLLQSKNTYSEVSPSGNGIRVILKLDGDKADLEGEYYLVRVGEGKSQEAQVNIGKPWMTITGTATPYAVEEVDTVTIEELDAVFAIKWRIDSSQTETKPVVEENVKLPALVEISKVLNAIPINPTPRVERAFRRVFNEEYQHYNYWLRMMMAVHDYAVKADLTTECFGVFVSWSEQDEEAFTGTDDVMKHWISLSEKPNKISYKTLFALYYKTTLRWPKPRKQTKEEVKAEARRKPIIAEYVNFEAMINHYNMILYRDKGMGSFFYITGDKDVMDKYFDRMDVRCHYGIYYGVYSVDGLVIPLTGMCQDHDFSGMPMRQTKEHVKLWANDTGQTLDIIKYYFDSDLEDLPVEYRAGIEYREGSSTDTLFECLDIDFLTDDIEAEEELYRSMYKKWLMGFVRVLDFSSAEHTNNSTLLLTGAEQIRKTSHFKYLLPPFFREDGVVFTVHGFENSSQLRDLYKIAAQAMVLVWDEFEVYLNNKTESAFKTFTDGNPIKIIDKYATTTIQVRPVALLGATSNRREFMLGSEGTRRIFHIPVKFVHTEKMHRVCWHTLINNMRREARQLKEKAWLLTDAELELQARLSGGMRTKSNYDIALQNMFNTEHDWRIRARKAKSFQRDRSGAFMTTQDVATILRNNGYDRVFNQMAHLEHSLTRFCGAYTKTQRSKIEFDKPKFTLHKGVAKQGRRPRWLMPPLRVVFGGTALDPSEGEDGTT